MICSSAYLEKERGGRHSGSCNRHCSPHQSSQWSCRCSILSCHVQLERCVFHECPRPPQTQCSVVTHSPNVNYIHRRFRVCKLFIEVGDTVIILFNVIFNSHLPLLLYMVRIHGSELTVGTMHMENVVWWLRSHGMLVLWTIRLIGPLLVTNGPPLWGGYYYASPVPPSELAKIRHSDE